LVDHEQAIQPQRSLRDAWLVIGGVSLLTIVAGCYVAFSNGAPPLRWGVVAASWGVGLTAALFVARAPVRIANPAFILLAPIALAATLLFDGPSGVQRWIVLGPLSMNVAAIVLPAMVVALASGVSLWAWACALACLAILIAQPDASQATSFAAACTFVLARAPTSTVLRWTGIAVAIAGAAAAWLIADPLEPVRDVEGIVQLAYATTPLLAMAMVACLACTLLSPVLIALNGRDTNLQTLSFALMIYLLATAITPLAGQFPIPIAGMSLSPILGFWLGVGLLTANGKAKP